MMIEGESDWLEGAMLIAVYFMLGIGFYYIDSQTARLDGIVTFQRPRRLPAARMYTWPE
jgi:hypothetical protein